MIQGETSVGKTSLITYLARRAGFPCYRINNHEHTDLQIYLGAYTAASASAHVAQINRGESDDSAPLSNLPASSLVFAEGILISAMRLGHWIILDELNLAPSDVLEALNRLLH
ncbi:unnamed protein product [Protopolystoma xenopodis]|uniref:ATPase dynein-related AAA domain-containing protein n=1 Tax=Protopolystoma xenopodis TaxID=117903 RepID=A0A3S5A7R8_9PLAT|nr:unnamed protein product [Protopolystoma xenopodis]